MRSFFATILGLAAAVQIAAPASAQPVQDAIRGLKPSINYRVIGGEPAADTAWPWQVMVVVPAIFQGRQGYAMCGGSVIAAQWVLTAAHCFNEFDRSRSIEVAERTSTAQKKTYSDINAKSLHRVPAPIVHPQYHHETSENDIALLHLREPVHSQAVGLLLAPNRELEEPPTDVVVTGWGRMREVDQSANGYVDPTTHAGVPAKDVDPDHLMEVELPLFPTPQCSALNKEVRGVIDARTLCAGLTEGGKDSCQGDSGGPMVVHTKSDRWIQIGVVSWGIGCARKDRPGVYTRVSAFADWIRANVGRDLVITADDGQGGEKPDPQGGLKPRPELDNAAGVAIAFDKGDEVKVGDVVSYRVTTRRPGYLAIFDATPDGKLTQIFPNARSLGSSTGARPVAARVSPDRPLLIPNYRNPYEGYKVVIEEPRGKGLMVAVLSDRPIDSLGVPDAPKTFESADAALAALGRLRNELSRGLAVEPSGKTPSWSVDMHEYTIK